MVEIITDKNQWNDWLKNSTSHTPFSQSWEWGDILLSEGYRVERLAIIDDDEVLAQAQVIYHNLPLGWKYAFCPKGPNLKISNSPDGELISDQSALDGQNPNAKIIGTLIEYCRDQRCVFIRIEPNIRLTTYDIRLHKTLDINPRATTILNLEKSDNELFLRMKPKTRYGIRLSQKKGLTISDKKDLSGFWNLSQLTGQHNKFSLHPKIHYKKVFVSDFSHQLSVFLSDKLIVSAVFVGFGDTFTYLYGASDYDHRSLMAPYLLQWEGIKLAKKSGYKYYDFFGIAPAVAENSNSPAGELSSKSEFVYCPNHQYAGVTRFKLGFGGEIQEVIGTCDFVINKYKYQFYNFFRQVNRSLKKYV